jgi:outer membrane receptor protein involved in Fe transport
MAMAFVLWGLAGNADPAAASPAAIDLPAGKLRDALAALSRQTGISVGMAGALPRLNTPRVKGYMEPGAALDILLANTSWLARRAGANTWLLELRPKPVLVRRPELAQPSKEIVVTATKRDERLADAPISVGVISGTTFAGTSAARNSSDLAGQTEGVFSTNLGPGGNRIFLRGVADSPFNGPTQSTVSLFLDDARINYAMPDPDLRLVDIDRVEILRGPQGTLYGSGSLGGIVRVVTMRPNLNDWSGMVASEATTVAHGDHGGALEGVFNVPLVQGTLALRAVAYADTVPGWIDDTGRGRSNVNRANRIGGRTDLRWQAGPAWTIDLSTALQNLDGHDSQYETAGRSRATMLAEPHRNQLRVGRIEVRGTIGTLDFLSTSAVEENNVRSRFDASVVADDRDLLAPLAFDEARHLTLITHEMRLSNPKAKRPWVFGVSLVRASNRTVGIFVPVVGVPLEVRNQSNHFLEGALFGEATQSLGRQFDLTLGLRTFVSRTTNDLSIGSNRQATEVGVTPSATLAWRPSPGKLLWLRYASAVRPGGLSEDSTGNTVEFQQDDLQSLELGSRLTLLDGRLALNASLFGVNWRHLQSDIIGPDGLIVTINGGDATNYGAELGTTLTLGPLSIDAGTTVQYGRLTSDNQLGGSDRRLPILPDLSGRLRFSYARNFAGIATNAYIGASYSGPARLSFDPTLDNSLSGHAVVNAGISAAHGSWRATLSVSNLFDNRSDTFSFGNPFTIRLERQHTPYQPRTIGLRFEHRF